MTTPTTNSIRSRSRRFPWPTFVIATCLALHAYASEDQPSTDAEPTESLRALQEFVGQWRGVGQPRRGSTRGAWQEESSWQWQFEPTAALQFRSPQGKYFREGRLTFDTKAKRYQLIVTPREGDVVTYVGSVDSQDRLSLTAEDAPQDLPARLSIRLVAAGKRMVVLYERRVKQSTFSRLAEIGYTRQGSRFGKGASYVECVVTGGLGTIPVTYEGKTYYVCCSGCRDYFNEHPAEVLAEYRERKEQERKEQAAQGDSK